MSYIQDLMIGSNVPVLNIISDLRVYTNYQNSPTVIVLGQNNINDGLGGTYTFDATNTTADDNKKYIQPAWVPSGAPGRYVFTAWNQVGNSINLDEYAKTVDIENWVSASYATNAFVEGNYVNGTAQGNVAITNIQMVNYTGTDNQLAYMQVATPAGALAIPSDANINEKIQNNSNWVSSTFATASSLSNYVTASTYNNDFDTSNGNVINLPFGHKIQAFSTTVNTGDWVTFPEAFSSTVFAVSITSTLEGGRPVLCAWSNWSNTGFNVTARRVDQNGSSDATGITIAVIAVGPR